MNIYTYIYIYIFLFKKIFSRRTNLISAYLDIHILNNPFKVVWKQKMLTSFVIC